MFDEDKKTKKQKKKQKNNRRILMFSPRVCTDCVCSEQRLFTIQRVITFQFSSNRF